LITINAAVMSCTQMCMLLSLLHIC